MGTAGFPPKHGDRGRALSCIKLDEPTDLPEGTVVPRRSANDWDDLDDEEREALHDAIREGFEDAKTGRTISAERWVARSIVNLVLI